MLKYVICVIVAVLSIGVILHLQVMVWDGFYPLTVQVIVDGETPQIVQGIAYPNTSEAEIMTQSGVLENAGLAQVSQAKPFSGEPMTVKIECSGRRTQLGWEYSRSQFQCLAILAEWSDGAKLIQFFPIPDGQKTRSLEISIKKPRIDEPQSARPDERETDQ